MKSLMFTLVGIVSIFAQKASAYVPNAGAFVPYVCAPIKYQANSGMNPIVEICRGHAYRERGVFNDAVSFRRLHLQDSLILLVGESKVEVCKLGPSCKYDRRETLQLYSQLPSVDQRVKLQIVTRNGVRTVIGREASNYSGVFEVVLTPMREL